MLDAQHYEAIAIDKRSDGIALATLNYAEALDARGQHARAEEQASTALGYFATSGNRWREIECLRLIGAINERQGDCADAIRCYQRALGLAEELGAGQDISIMRECLTRARTRAVPGTGTRRSPQEHRISP